MSIINSRREATRENMQRIKRATITYAMLNWYNMPSEKTTNKNGYKYRSLRLPANIDFLKITPIWGNRHYPTDSELSFLPEQIQYMCIVDCIQSHALPFRSISLFSTNFLHNVAVCFGATSNNIVRSVDLKGDTK